MVNRKIIYIGFAFSHHKKSIGGYHHIAKHVRYDHKISLQLEHEFPWFNKPVLFRKILNKSRRFIFGERATFGILHVLYLNLRYRNLLFHFIYPENSFKWLHYVIRKENKIAFTIHQPTEFYKNKKWIKILSSIDLIISLKESQVDEIKQLTNKENCVFIPHGIGINILKKKNSNKKRKILMVGNWLREFEVARDVFKLIKEVEPSIEIVLVCNEENLKHFNGLDITKRSKVTNDELLNHYRESAVLFCPLKDFTANNSILEAAALGCHIFISSKTKNTSNYIPKDYLTLTSLEINEIVPRLINKALNPNLLASEELSSFIQNKYSWETIGAEVTKAFNSIP